MAAMEPTKRIDSLFERISALIEQARGYVVNSVKIAEVKTRYEVGRYIYEDEQQGERAAYGNSSTTKFPMAMTNGISSLVKKETGKQVCSEPTNL